MRNHPRDPMARELPMIFSDPGCETGAKDPAVVAKVEWHLGMPYPRARFICGPTCHALPMRVAAFYNHCGTAEQHIKDGKNAIN